MSNHQHTDQCDHTEVASYAPAGRRWWPRPWNDHGPACPDLVCADTRRALGIKPLTPSLAAPKRERRSA